MTIDVTAVITALLTLLGTVITAFVVPWLRCRTSAQAVSYTHLPN